MTAKPISNENETMLTPKLIKAAKIIVLIPLLLLILLLIPVIAVIKGILDHLTDEKEPKL